MELRAEPVFRSLLFADGRLAGESAPAYLADLRLDTLIERMCARREEYDLAPLFCERLRTTEEIERRQRIFQDLERAEVRRPVDEFATAMRTVREQRSLGSRRSHPLQQQAWLLASLRTYAGAAEGLAESLRQARLDSEGMRALAAFLEGYVGTPAFGRLRDEAGRLSRELSAVRFQVHLRGNHVRVMRDAGGTDYTREVTATFARFLETAPQRRREPADEGAEGSVVEARILDGVASLHPQLFGELAAFCTEQREAIDATLRRFDREVQFFTAYLDQVHAVRRGGLEFSYPHVSAGSRELSAGETFDLALAAKQARERQSVVANDVQLSGAERVLVLTGPNQGGKTTFARAVGQLHHLAALGCPVPGAAAHVPLCDHILTLFPREEDSSLTRGKLEDDLVRTREVLDAATPMSLVILNEVFSSTALRDALALSRRVLERIIAAGTLCVCVTFLDELSRLGPSTVSMVALVDPDDPAVRTFRLVRWPADGHAYAQALAEKHRLTESQVRERIGR